MIRQYSVYADESGYPHEPVQSVCMIGGETTRCDELYDRCAPFFSAALKNEIKFSKIKAANGSLERAKQLLSIVLEMVAEKKLFLRCLVDTQATEHTLPTLYKKLFVMLREATVQTDRVVFFPDEKHFENLFASLVETTAVHPSMVIYPQQSHHHIAIQACDLVTGLCRDARLHRGAYLLYLTQPKDHLPKTILNKTKTARAELLKFFLESVNACEMNVSYRAGYLESSGKDLLLETFL